MTDFPSEEEIRRNLEDDWGPAAPYSDYKRGESIRYRADGELVYTGTIPWCTAPGPSRIEGHDDLPMHYVVARDRWADDSFPDVVYQGDILTQEPELVKCPWCSGYHYKGQEQYCDRNPNKP